MDPPLHWPVDGEPGGRGDTVAGDQGGVDPAWGVVMSRDIYPGGWSRT